MLYYIHIIVNNIRKETQMKHDRFSKCVECIYERSCGYSPLAVLGVRTHESKEDCALRKAQSGDKRKQ